MNPIDFFLEPLQYEFMTRAILTTVIAAIVCALLSCWLVLIGWSLMGDAVSHAVLPGVVLAYVVGAPFALGALLFGFLAVALIGGIRSTTRVKEDAAIGIVFTTLFALGLVLISVTPSDTDLNHIIFGNILGVSPSDLLQIAVLAAVALAVLIIKRRDLTLFAFDPTHAQAIGLNPKFLGALLLGLLALTAVVALQVVGVVLVVAMLIIPGATAYLLTDRFGRMLVIAPVLSATCAVLGIFLSYWLDAASGGLVVLVQGGRVRPRLSVESQPWPARETSRQGPGSSERRLGAARTDLTRRGCPPRPSAPAAPARYADADRTGEQGDAGGGRRGERYPHRRRQFAPGPKHALRANIRGPDPDRPRQAVVAPVGGARYGGLELRGGARGQPIPQRFRLPGARGNGVQRQLVEQQLLASTQ